MMTDFTKPDPANMELWNAVYMSDPEHVKHVEYGAFKFSTANAMYNVRRMTERFGPCGADWGFEVVDSRIEEFAAPDGATDIREKCWFVTVKLWYRLDGERMQGFTHSGSAMLLAWVKEKNGRDAYWSGDDEALKKATTNALSKCLSMLGFSADLWFDEYNPENRREYTEHAKRVLAQQSAAQSAEAIAKMLDGRLNNVIGCKTDEDREAVCRWASDAVYGYAMAKSDPTVVANAILNHLAGISKTGLPWAAFLTEAKRGLTNTSDLHVDAVSGRTGHAKPDGVDQAQRPVASNQDLQGPSGQRQKPAASVPTTRQDTVAGNSRTGGIRRKAGTGVVGDGQPGGGRRPPASDTKGSGVDSRQADGRDGGKSEQDGEGGGGGPEHGEKGDQIPFG